MTKWVYSFGDGKAEGDATMKNLLGGKGANLAEMSNLGLPVPPGFSITTEVCSYFYGHGKSYPADLKPAVDSALATVGLLAGATFGDSKRPYSGVLVFPVASVLTFGLSRRWAFAVTPTRARRRAPGPA